MAQNSCLVQHDAQATTVQTQHRPVQKRRHTATRVSRIGLPHNRSTTKLHRAKNSKDTLRRSSVEVHDTFWTASSDAEEDMSSPFLQYCPSCEKQLPTSSGLYCSEACRKTDLRSSGSYYTAPSPSSPREAYFKDIIPQMSPTLPTQPMFADELSTLSDSKRSPALRGRSKRERPSYDRTDSDAARYLAQFHSGSQSPSRIWDSRPSTGSSSVPGLSMTPLSLNTSSMPLTPSSTASYRPPLRKNKWSSSFEVHTEELVTPIPPEAASPTSLSTITERSLIVPGLSVSPATDETNMYAKRRTIPPSGSAPKTGSLKQLFRSGDTRLATAGTTGPEIGLT